MIPGEIKVLLTHEVVDSKAGEPLSANLCLAWRRSPLMEVRKDYITSPAQQADTTTRPRHARSRSSAFQNNVLPQTDVKHVDTISKRHKKAVSFDAKMLSGLDQQQHDGTTYSQRIDSSQILLLHAEFVGILETDEGYRTKECIEMLQGREHHYGTSAKAITSTQFLPLGLQQAVHWFTSDARAVEDYDRNMAALQAEYSLGSSVILAVTHNINDDEKYNFPFEYSVTSKLCDDFIGLTIRNRLVLRICAQMPDMTNAVCDFPLVRYEHIKNVTKYTRKDAAYLRKAISALRDSTHTASGTLVDEPQANCLHVPPRSAYRVTRDSELYCTIRLSRDRFMPGTTVLAIIDFFGTKTKTQYVTARLVVRQDTLSELCRTGSSTEMQQSRALAQIGPLICVHQEHVAFEMTIPMSCSGTSSLPIASLNYFMEFDFVETTQPLTMQDTRMRHGISSRPMRMMKDSTFHCSLCITVEQAIACRPLLAGQLQPDRRGIATEPSVRGMQR